MPTVFDVAAYVMHQQRGRITTKKLQKLVFYSQVWSLAWNHGPLFDESVEAWREGPVVRALWEEHRGRYFVSEAFVSALGNPDRLSADQKLDIDAVLSVYSCFSAEELGDMSHEEVPWRVARNSVDQTITIDMMRDFYRALDVAARPLNAQGRFLLNSLLANVTSENRHAVIDWGNPIGREAW